MLSWKIFPLGKARIPATWQRFQRSSRQEITQPTATRSAVSWKSHPLGAQTTPEQPTQEFAEEATPPAEAAAEAAGESVTAEAEEPQQWTEAAAQPDQAIEEPAAPEEQPAAEEPQQWAEPTEQSAAETAPEIEQPAPEEPYYAEQAAEQPAEPEMPVEEVAEEYSDQQGELKLEGWVAPPSEPEPQGAGWLGEAEGGKPKRLHGHPADLCACRRGHAPKGTKCRSFREAEAWQSGVACEQSPRLLPSGRRWPAAGRAVIDQEW